MAQTSDELKSEIEQTRDQLSETADALAYKADVPTRTKDWIGEKKDAVVSTVSGVTSKAGEITPDGAEVSQSMNRMKRLAERNPVGLAIGGAAVGFIAGLLAPSTRMEDERIGPMADDVKATAADAGREAFERGKDVVQEAGATAIETAKERGREEGEELSESLQEKAREVAPGEAPTAGPAPSVNPPVTATSPIIKPAVKLRMRKPKEPTCKRHAAFAGCRAGDSSSGTA